MLSHTIPTLQLTVAWAGARSYIRPQPKPDPVCGLRWQRIPCPHPFAGSSGCTYLLGVSALLPAFVPPLISSPSFPNPLLHRDGGRAAERQTLRFGPPSTSPLGPTRSARAGDSSSARRRLSHRPTQFTRSAPGVAGAVRNVAAVIRKAPCNLLRPPGDSMIYPNLPAHAAVQTPRRRV